VTYSLISLHSYLILNAALAFGYVLSRFTLSLPFLKRSMLYNERLKFARFSFVTVIASFFVVPNILAIIPSAYHSNFQLEPILKNASMPFLQQHKMINDQIIQMGAVQSAFPIHMLLMLFLSVGVTLFVGKYLKSLLILRKFQQNAFCQHHIKNVKIVFSHKADNPFCWSFLQNHYIAIPNAFLEKSDDLKLAIRHELQHIRQHDTQWLHLLTLIKAFCFWNPFILLWIKLFHDLQEFSCDEAIVLRMRTSPAIYAQCLINAASTNFTHKHQPQGVLGMHGSSKSILYKRVNMLFTYNKSQTKKLTILFAYFLTFFTTISSAYALNGTAQFAPLSANEVKIIIEQSHLDSRFEIAATPEVVTEINNIRSSEQARGFMRKSLKRMEQYQPAIQAALTKNVMPKELLALPLVESGYQPLEQARNPVQAAGIWQIIPGTADHLGLIVNAKRDDRLNTTLATQAALALLKTNNAQFNSWKLAVIAYEYGDQLTDKFIHAAGSRDAWKLARASTAPASLKKFLATFDAAVIIIHNPSLIADKG